MAHSAHLGCFSKMKEEKNNINILWCVSEVKNMLLLEKG